MKELKLILKQKRCILRETARIITGLPSYVNVSAFRETQKIENNLAPNYLHSLLPPKVADTTTMLLRLTAVIESLFTD